MDHLFRWRLSLVRWSHSTTVYWNHSYIMTTTGTTKATIPMITVSAPTNIAVIKYWGKANLALNTPLNDSVSVTLHQDDLRAVTTVAASKSFTEHSLWLNGTRESVLSSRVLACLQGVAALATDGAHGYSTQEWLDMKFHISSYNTFPTAAGLASSAAGYAALVFGLAQLVQAQETFKGQLSCIARQGSGSACRSLYGGFVAWRKGDDDSAPNGDLQRLHETSKAELIADESHWPEIRALLCVVSDAMKTTSSTSGMVTSVATSSLLQYRAKHIVPERMHQMCEAWRHKDFTTFAQLTMQDSNQFHAICLDTYPPICYMNDVSRNIVRVVTAYNAFYNDGDDKDKPLMLQAAYTFDAGPNAVLYCLQEYVEELEALMRHYFVSDSNSNVDLAPDLIQACDKAVYGAAAGATSTTDRPSLGKVQTIYHTRPGPGPRIVTDECNLDPETGLNTYTKPK